MVVSLKANKKRIIAFLILAAVVAGACFLLRSGKEEAPAEISGRTNEERLSFLESFGWQVDPEPVETREVMIPEKFNDVYVTYNVMQKAQGFDLKPYAGAVCTQYRYHISNYEGETEVYATLLVHADLIIGGDVACAEVDGFMHGFAKDSARYGETGKGGKMGSGSAASEASSQPEPASSAAESGEEPSSQAGGEAESTAAQPAEEDYPTD